MKRIVLFAVALAFGLTVSAQTFSGTMKIDGETLRNVSVKFDEKSDSTGNMASVMIRRVLTDVMKTHKIDLVIPNIEITVTPQRQVLVCYNVIPQSDGAEVRDYLIREFHGAVTSDVLSFWCVLGERRIVYNGVLDKVKP